MNVIHALVGGFGLSLALVSVPAGGAFAHGTIPTANAIAFMPDGTLFLGTNFGGIERGAAGDVFLCETAVTGTQQAIDLWRVTSDGRIGAAVVGGGFERGLFVSDAAGCVFAQAGGTGDVAVAQVAVDGEAFLVAGTRPQQVGCADCPEVGVVLRVPRTGPVEPVAAGGGGLAATGVVAGGGQVVAVFSEAGRAEVDVGDGQPVSVTLAASQTLVPLGIGPGRALYAVLRSDDGDEVVASLDLFRTWTSLGTVRGRVVGFAASASEVWVQSPQTGVMTRSGDALVEVAASPHGGCLAWHDGALWACGVPWQDGFAVGKQAGGGAFAAVMPFFDGVAAARSCEPVTITSTCQTELDFLRGYYGFGPVAEPGPEVVEAVEVGPEVVEGTAEEDAGDTAPVAEAEVVAPRDEGCGGAGLSAWWLVAALIAARRGPRAGGLGPRVPRGARR